jgi:hypothetical protein
LLTELTRQGGRPCGHRGITDLIPIWVAVERQPQVQTLFEQVVLTPPIKVPEEFANRSWIAAALIVRSRLEGLDR